MKILYTLNSSKFGGMEVHVLDLVKGMVKKGNEVFVWCPEGEMSELYKEAGASVSKEVIKRDIDGGYIKRLTNFVQENHIEIVHAHELKAVINSLLACKKAGVKLITHTHTPISEWQINVFKRFLDAKLYSFMVNKYSDVEIALTNSKKDVKIKEGIKEEKISVIPNGLNTSKFHISSIQRYENEKEIKSRYSIPQDAFVFGNLGRVSKEKGHDVLIRAFAKFLDSHIFRKEKFYLLIVGGGVLEEKIVKLVKELELDKNVVITGRFEDTDKIKYLSTFDVFVFPTLAEGFGIVLIESLFMGIPTIASDLEVLKEVGGDFVDFFKVGDSHDLADKMIEEYNKTGGDNQFIIEGARDFVEKNYSMDNFVNQYENLYKKLLGENK